MKRKKNTKDDTPLSKLMNYISDNFNDEVVDVHVHLNSNDDEFISKPCTNSEIVNQNIANSIVLFSILMDATDCPQIEHACKIFQINKEEFLQNIGELANMYAHYGLEEIKVKLN